MRISERNSLPGTPDQVRELMLSIEYQQEKCRRSGAVDFHAALEPQGTQDADPSDDADEHNDAPVLVVRRSMPSDDLPDFARSLVGRTLDIVETYTWDAAPSGTQHSASLGLAIEGTPVTFTGSVLLEATDAGTDQVVTGDLSAHIPLLGGRIEKAAAPAFLAGLRVEQRLAVEWLGA